MYDFHMHSTVSFDGHCSPMEMAAAARNAGLLEICFTDHIDHDIHMAKDAMTFSSQDYHRAYDDLYLPGLEIRRGMEFGMKPHNQMDFEEALSLYPFDFVLGSVHFVQETNVYKEDYWKGKTALEAETLYLEEMLRCVNAHDDYDVLAHLNFLSKSPYNLTHTAMAYGPHREILDEILKILVKKGKGLEMNTSGFMRGVGFLPGEEFFRRFRELGGEIVTVGSDAHRTERVGENIPQALDILRDIFGYVCTFRDRHPVFHKL